MNYRTFGSDRRKLVDNAYAATSFFYDVNLHSGAAETLGRAY